MVKNEKMFLIDLLPRIGMMTMLLLAQLNPVLVPPAMASPDAIQTIGDFLSLGANTVRELQKAIEVAGGETRDTLSKLQNDINSLVQSLSQTYQDNLDITINSLDYASRNKILELQSLIDKVNKTLQQDITLAGQTAKDVIRQASIDIERVSLELEQSLKNVIIVGGETAAYVVDRAIYDAILIVSLILLGIGLLLFIWLFYSKRLPQGLTGTLALVLMISYLVVFGAMALVPTARGYAMVYTGVGLHERLDKAAGEPRILQVVPDTIILGQTSELEIWGSLLNPENKSLTVEIAGKSVGVSAASDQLVVVSVASLNVPDGSTNVVLKYNGVEGARGVVKITHPAPPQTLPNLVVTGFVINPSSPVKNGNAHATITISNQGGGQAGSFRVMWRPYATHNGLTAQVTGLNPGESKQISFDFAYPNAGTFDTVVIADDLNDVAETNEADNSITRSITVQSPPSPTEHLVTDKDVIVKESDYDVDTGIDIVNNDRVVFSASGEIWAGVWATGNNGPEGWTNYQASDTSPLPKSPPFSVLGKLGTRYFYVGSSLEYRHGIDSPYDTQTRRLYLRINDDKPGNGNGQFTVNIKVYRSE